MHLRFYRVLTSKKKKKNSHYKPKHRVQNNYINRISTGSRLNNASDCCFIPI